MFFDPTGIVLLTAPIFFPIVMSLGFDPMWFAILFVINMEIAYLTPPFGFNLFYMKAVAPPGVTMWDIYKSALTFVLLMIFGLRSEEHTSALQSLMSISYTVFCLKKKHQTR